MMMLIDGDDEDDDDADDDDVDDDDDADDDDYDDDANDIADDADGDDDGCLYVFFVCLLQHRLDHPGIHATVQQRLAHYTARKHSTTRERNRKTQRRCNRTARCSLFPQSKLALIKRMAWAMLRLLQEKTKHQGMQQSMPAIRKLCK